MNTPALRENMNKIQIGAAITTVTTAWNMYNRIKDAYQEYRENQMYSVFLSSSSLAYDSIRELAADSVVNSRDFNVIESSGVVRVQPNLRSAVLMEINGHAFSVELDRVDASSAPNGDAMMSIVDAGKARTGLIFRTFDYFAIESLREFIAEKERAARMRMRPPTRYFPESGGYWSSGHLPKRSLESVILRGNDKEDVVEDFENFLGSEDKYLRMGIPYHRGYLLHGEPGNGKSSLVMSLANDYGKDLYVLSPNAIEGDGELNIYVNGIKPGSIMVIEDIDVYSGSVTRDSASKQPTLAGLLNVLDGAFTPHGLITFMTTNHVDRLDPALVRAGRIDYRIAMNGPTDEQISRAFRHIYDEDLMVNPGRFTSMAEFIGIVKRHYGDPASARDEIALGSLSMVD